MQHYNSLRISARGRDRKLHTLMLAESTDTDIKTLAIFFSEISNTIRKACLYIVKHDTKITCKEQALTIYESLIGIVQLWRGWNRKSRCWNVTKPMWDGCKKGAESGQVQMSLGGNRFGRRKPKCGVMDWKDNRVVKRNCLPGDTGFLVNTFKINVISIFSWNVIYLGYAIC